MQRSVAIIAARRFGEDEVNRVNKMSAKQLLCDPSVVVQFKMEAPPIERDHATHIDRAIAKRERRARKLMAKEAL